MGDIEDNSQLSSNFLPGNKKFYLLSCLIDYISEAINKGSNNDTIYPLISHLIHTIYESVSLNIARYDHIKNNINIVYSCKNTHNKSHTLTFTRSPPEEEIISQAIISKEIIHIHNYNEIKQFDLLNPEHLGQSQICLPIIYQGKAIGAWTIFYDEMKLRFNREDFELFNVITTLLALYLQNENLSEQLDYLNPKVEHPIEEANLYQQTRKGSVQAQLLDDVTTKMHETLDIDLLLQIVAVEFQKIFELAEVEVRLIPNESSEDMITTTY